MPFMVSVRNKVFEPHVLLHNVHHLVKKQRFDALLFPGDYLLANRHGAWPLSDH